MNKFDQNEFLSICKKFNMQPYISDLTIRYQTASFFKKMKNSVEKDRRGEVVFCVLRPNGKAIAVTCADYPEGIFRIPTGGINYGEDIVEAVYREVKEELGLTVEIIRFAGVIKIKFEHDDENVMFYSYIFIMEETGGKLLADAVDDEVSEVKEVDLYELEGIVNSLKALEGKWGDWGKFRYESSNAILNVLRSMKGNSHK